MSAQLELDGRERLTTPETWDVISPCGQYRYVLGHRWAAGGKLAVFGLCNPSTATKDKPDATSRACDGFARVWGCSGRVIVNPCAYRSTDSLALLDVADPVGSDNAMTWSRVFWRAADEGAPVVFGWEPYEDPP